ncbi:MAG: hypothetical protein GXO12_06755, partial [Epsilonproteobacteria bacterium]|nr:hypothetical protein [Campylobacterota bacterium]
MGISKEKIKPYLVYYAMGISLFHFYINIIGGISDLWFNAAHFSFLASLGFLTYRASKFSDK